MSEPESSPSSSPSPPSSPPPSSPPPSSPPPSLPVSPKKRDLSSRRPLVLIGLGALVLGAIGMAFVTAERPSILGNPSREAAPARGVISELEAPLQSAAQDGAAEAMAKAMPETGALRGKFSGNPPSGGMAPPAPPLPPGYAGAGGPMGGLLDALKEEIVLDPNGRFATTYRPGGGHLNAFEAAISQGIFSQNDRELIADVGARYAPTIAVSKEQALAFQFDWERAKLQPEGGTVHLRLGFRSSAEAPTTRPHLSVHLVLDVSGSMGGKPMEDARNAAKALVEKLAPEDDFSLTTFASLAELVVPDGPVGVRRPQILKTIEGIREGGGTNIGEGLKSGYQQARSKSIPEDAVRVVFLLSDGRANEGIIQQGQLTQLALNAFQDGIQTSSFGIGTDYDGPLMSAIAGDGAGGYYYLRDSEQIAPALTSELDKRLDPVATAVEIRVRFKPEVELLKVYGSRRLSHAEAAVVRTQEIAIDEQAQKRDKIKKNRNDDQEGGMRFFIPAFARDDSHAILLKIRLPKGVGSKPVAVVEVKYKDRLSKKNKAEEFPLKLVYADSDAESGASINPSVARTVQGFLAGETLADASSFVARGNLEKANLLLAEREEILRAAAASLTEPLFLRDADRLARMRSLLLEPRGRNRDSLVLSMLLETASQVHLR